MGDAGGCAWGWWSPWAPERTPVERVDEERLAIRAFERRVEDGVEPHPGPAPVAGGGTQLNPHAVTFRPTVPPVDSRIRVWWTGEGEWYCGRIVEVRDGVHGVAYDDGELLWHDLRNEKWEYTRRRANTRTIDTLDVVGCPFGHKSPHTTWSTGGGGGRRAYICGRCEGKFVQNDPAMPEFTYADRRPVWQEGPIKRRKQILDLCPPDTGKSSTDVRTKCLGDVLLRWHNSGGLADLGRRRRYLRRVIRGADAVGI